MYRSRTYWTVLFSGATWEEFRSAKSPAAGFRENRWAAAQKIRPGDVLIFYLTGISRWIGTGEVSGKPYQSDDSAFSSGVFPCRVPVDVRYSFDPDLGLPVVEMLEDLDLFSGLKSANSWSWRFCSSPRSVTDHDGAAVVDALEHQARIRRVRPFNPKKLNRRRSYSLRA